MSSFKVKFVFTNHPDWNTEELWETSEDEVPVYTESPEMLATSINSKLVSLVATELNPDIKLDYFKQRAVVEDGKVIVTIE